MLILGAGLAGCIAGLMLPGATIIESGPNKTTHNALLRFKSLKISSAVGIPFKKVKVYKGIWHNDQSVPLTPRAIALYSRKVSDTIAYRSITNLDTVERYIAPQNFHELLKEQLADRIAYGQDFRDWYSGEAIISTLPLFVNADTFLDKKITAHQTKSAPIFVNRFTIPECDVYMTYYFTDPTTAVYRASITGDQLIIESTFKIAREDFNIVKRAFGLSGMTLEQTMYNREQALGKIVPMDEKLRRSIIVELTANCNLYSLGRFATWRNLLLDDVYDDINVIKRLVNSDLYSVIQEHTK